MALAGPQVCLFPLETVRIIRLTAGPLLNALDLKEQVEIKKFNLSV